MAYIDNPLTVIAPEKKEADWTKDVIFIDHTGFVHYAYTASEFLALSEMPSVPEIEGLTSAGWNWSLSDAQAYVTKYQELVIGATYNVKDDILELGFCAVQDGMTVCVCFDGSDGKNLYIDWGDGSIETEMTLAGWYSKVYSDPHTYSDAGHYSIKVRKEADSTFRIYGGGVVNDSSHNSLDYLIDCAKLGSIDEITNNTLGTCRTMSALLVPTTCRFGGTWGIFGKNSIPAFVFSSSNGTSLDYGALADTNIKYLSAPSATTSFGNYKGGTRSLRRIHITNSTTTLSNDVFRGSVALYRVRIPETVTSIANGAFASCSGLREIYFYGTTPPTLGASTSFSDMPTTCVIYVPTGTLETYKAATNYPDPDTYTYEEF